MLDMELTQFKTHGNEKTDRNIQIYTDKKNGMSWSKLREKWQLSQRQVLRIVKRWEHREAASN